MPPFNKKEWLDANVASLHPNLSMVSFFWNGSPPKEVYAITLVKPAKEDEALEVEAWPKVVKDLVDKGFRFDVLRDFEKVPKEEGGFHLLFGGDGMPLFGNGSTTVRLFRKGNHGIALILEVTAKYPNPIDCANAVKAVFNSFDCDPMELASKYGTPFGAA